MYMPVSFVRDLGIFLDSNVSMKTHVAKLVSSCFAALRQIRSVRHSVSSPVLQSLVSALVLSRLDYGNATLYGLPDSLISRLKSAQNAAARLIYRSRRSDHVTPLLPDLHWLRVAERVESSSSWRRSCTDVWVEQRRPIWHRSFNVLQILDRQWVT